MDTEPAVEKTEKKSHKAEKKDNKTVKKRIFKYVRNIIIAAIVLLVLLVIAFVVYTWFMGQNSADVPEVEPPKTSKAPVLRRPPFDPNARVGVSLQTLTTPIAAGDNASMTIKTNPEAKCTITAVYNKVPSTDSGLSPKTADEFGMVSWSWTVEPSVPLGKWPVTVTCAKGKQSGVYIGYLVISKNGT